MATKPRTVQTPGAPTTADKAEDALNAILSTPDAQEKAPTSDVGTSDTSTASELVEEDAERKEYEEFLAWKKIKSSANTPTTQHVPTSDATGVVQARTFLGPDGWTSKEVG